MGRYRITRALPLRSNVADYRPHRNGSVRRIGWLGASLRSSAHLLSQSIKILLISGFKKLACLFGKLPIFKHTYPRNDGSIRNRFERNGKLKVRQIDMSNPNQQVGDNFQELRLIGIVLPVRTMHCELPRSALTEFECVKRIREPIRAPPASKTRWILDGSKNRFTRSRKLSASAEDGHITLQKMEFLRCGSSA